MHPWLTHVDALHKPPQYCKAISLQLESINFIKREIWVQSLGQEDPMEAGMATHPVSLPGEFHAQKSGGLHLVGSQRVRYDSGNLAHTCDKLPITKNYLV